MDLNKYTIKAQEAVQRAQQLALENENQAIECGHLLRGVLLVDENVVPHLFQKLSANLNALDQLSQRSPTIAAGSDISRVDDLSQTLVAGHQGSRPFARCPVDANAWKGSSQ